MIRLFSGPASRASTPPPTGDWESSRTPSSGFIWRRLQPPAFPQRKNGGSGSARGRSGGRDRLSELMGGGAPGGRRKGQRVLESLRRSVLVSDEVPVKIPVVLVADQGRHRGEGRGPGSDQVLCPLEADAVDILSEGAAAFPPKEGRQIGP